MNKTITSIIIAIVVVPYILIGILWSRVNSEHIYAMNANKIQDQGTQTIATYLAQVIEFLRKATNP